MEAVLETPLATEPLVCAPAPLICRAAPVSEGATAPATAVLDPRAEVAAMSLPEKFLRAGKYGIMEMPEGLGRQVAALFTPESLETMAKWTAVFIAAQWTPAGWATDVGIGLTVISVALAAPEVVAILEEAKAYVLTAARATSEAELREAGHHLATALSKGTVDLVVAWLLHKTTKSLGPKGAATKFLSELVGPRDVVMMVTPDGVVWQAPPDAYMSTEAPAEGGSGRGRSMRTEQWWLRDQPGLAEALKRSTEGYQTYVLRDAQGRPRYVGKSGGAGGVKPQNWMARVREHISDPRFTDWIGEIERIEVRSGLTEMEAFALEEQLIGDYQSAGSPIENISQGEFSTRFPQADLAANAHSAMSRAPITFEGDIVR